MTFVTIYGTPPEASLGLQPSDPALLSGVAVLFLIIALLAAYPPARRATLIDPVTALRAE